VLPVSSILRARVAPRPASRPVEARVVCHACGLDEGAASARDGGWQIARDGRVLHCPGCADLRLVVLDDQVLYWPVCGHALDDDDALYDRPACVRCETG
jgi:hypothetical protein